MDTQPKPGETREDSALEVDRAIAAASGRAAEFARLPPEKKAELLDRVAEGLVKTAADTVALGCEAKGIERGAPAEAEEWFAGPCVTVALARHHAAALRDIAARGRPRLSSFRVKQSRNGRVVTHLGPMFSGGGLIETGLSFRVLHQAGTARGDVIPGQTELARSAAQAEPGTTAVLGAGNVSSIPVADVIHALFVENRTAVLKMNPVNAYLRGPLAQALAPLIEPGYVQIIDGGAEVGAALVGDPRITHVHLTGSAETHDRIVWGPRDEQAGRKERNEPALKKPVTSELGNVSPILITPYLYSKSELRSIAYNIATQLSNNASFNCNAGKMLILPRNFPQRELLLEALCAVLGAVPARKAYYPGAADRYAALTENRQGVVRVGNAGEPKEGKLPWTLITEVDAAAKDEPLFRTEPFCSLLSVVEVGSLDPVAFLREAVKFCNERLWGTLSACLFVPPLYDDDGVVEHAVEEAIVALEYGAVGVNVWPAVVYATARAPWGGHLKGTLADVQSGIGFVHNPLFLPRIEKTVVVGPLQPLPKPPYTVGHPNGLTAARRLAAYADSPRLGTAFDVATATFFG